MTNGHENPVAADELLTRFVYGSDKVNRSGRVKDSAFLPQFESQLGRDETSVCRMQGCTEDRIWHLGRISRSDRTLAARADFSCQVVIDAQLTCVAAPVAGYPEHAVLIGWPADKEEKKVIARALAKASTAKFPPP